MISTDNHGNTIVKDDPESNVNTLAIEVGKAIATAKESTIVLISIFGTSDMSNKMKYLENLHFRLVGEDGRGNLVLETRSDGLPSKVPCRYVSNMGALAFIFTVGTDGEWYVLCVKEGAYGDPGKYVIKPPGGHVEPGILPLHTAISEAREETGIELSIKEHYRGMVGVYTRAGKPFNDAIYGYAFVVPNDIEFGDPEDHPAERILGIKWVRAVDFPNVNFFKCMEWIPAIENFLKGNVCATKISDDEKEIYAAS